MKNHQTEKAFTLLEVVVSLALLIMVFGSATSLLILTRESEQVSKNNLIATYLAKEGEELVRYQRDKNYLDSLQAFAGLISSEIEAAQYSFLIDYQLADPIIPSTETNVKLVPPLKINETSFYDNRSVGTATIFRRLVTTTYHQATSYLPAYIDVKIQVYWQSDTKKDTYTLTSQLFDWR